MPSVNAISHLGTKVASHGSAEMQGRVPELLELAPQRTKYFEMLC